MYYSKIASYVAGLTNQKNPLKIENLMQLLTY